VTFPALLEGLLQGADLSRAEANEVMRSLMSGGFEEAQIGAFLVAMRTKGATANELAGFAEVMRENASGLGRDFPDLVDTCGTGGGPATFNLSTGAAIVAAAAGAKVAKHGNRAVTSKCGSADVLEALGVCLSADPEQLTKSLEQIGLVFLFAPNHHPAMRHVGPARKAIGVRTVFNQLGPLANPAGARRQLVGVYDLSMVVPMAEALALLGCEAAYVVHSAEGMDEVSPCGKTFAAVVREGRVLQTELSPHEFGLATLGPEALAPGEDAAANAAILQEAVTDPDSKRSQALLPNAAVALVLSGHAQSLAEGAEMARAAVASGRAATTLQELATWTS
jgi:anthranilate phosphoribosyltransferase